MTEYGELVFEYNSSRKNLSNIQAFIKTFEIKGLKNIKLIKAMLTPRIRYIFEVYRHLEIIDCMGLNDWSIGYDFNSIHKNKGPLHDGHSLEELTFIEYKPDVIYFNKKW